MNAVGPAGEGDGDGVAGAFCAGGEDHIALGIADLALGLGTVGKVVQPRIDYIMTRGFEATAEPVAWTEEAYGVYLSDHYPLMAELNPLY